MRDLESVKYCDALSDKNNSSDFNRSSILHEAAWGMQAGKRAGEQKKEVEKKVKLGQRVSKTMNSNLV